MENIKIEISINGQSASVQASIPEPVKATKKALADYSWDEIKAIGKAGLAPEYFSIGEKKDILLTNGEVLTMAIADFNHDTDSEGNIIPITFTPVNVLEEDCTMKGMKAYLVHFFEVLLPEDVRKVVTPAMKNGKPCAVFLHNEMEIFGKTIYSNDTEGSQYPYYAEKCHRCKFKNSKEYAATWWERSAYYDTSNLFCVVSYIGSADYYGAYYSYAVAPAFGV